MGKGLVRIIEPVLLIGARIYLRYLRRLQPGVDPTLFSGITCLECGKTSKGGAAPCRPRSPSKVRSPSPSRSAMRWASRPAARWTFAVNRDGQVVLHKAASAPGQRVAKPQPDRFDAARGKADVKWRTQDLMALLRD
jgi:antitoxin PrlF